MTPFDSFSRDFKSKKVLIFGLGLLGRGIGDARLFAQIGSQVRVTDLKTATALESALSQLKPYPIEYILGEHRPEDIDWADVIIRNASVDWHHPLLEMARKQDKPIYMDTQLFATYASIPLIGITGTRGKTTTTLMTHHLLSTLLPQRQILLGGNIKDIATLELLSQLDFSRSPLAVLELSSWQLQGFDAHQLSPHIAVITNIYEDHLNKYPSFKAYYQDKQKIYSHQTSSDHLILNRGIKLFHTWARKASSQVHWFDSSQVKHVQLQTLGEHNYENAAAAFLVATILGLSSSEITTALADFQPVSQRLEIVGNYNNIRFINDSTSTTPIALLKAVQSIEAPIRLIMGGEDKNLSLSGLAPALNQKTERIYLLKGKGTERILPELNPSKVSGPYTSLKESFAAVMKDVKAGETVLFSPGFTSFGLYQNEYERGDDFTYLVQNIKLKQFK